MFCFVFLKVLFSKALHKGTGEMAQLLKELATLPEDSSLIPSTHMMTYHPVPGDLMLYQAHTW